MSLREAAKALVLHASSPRERFSGLTSGRYCQVRAEHVEALRRALSEDAAPGEAPTRGTLALIQGEKVPDQGCFVAEDGAGEKMCRKPTWVCLSHWEEVNRERVRLANRNAELEPEVATLRAGHAALDAECQRLGFLLAAATADPPDTAVTVALAPAPRGEQPAPERECVCGHAESAHAVLSGYAGARHPTCLILGGPSGGCRCEGFQPRKCWCGRDSTYESGWCGVLHPKPASPAPRAPGDDR